ncbi:hypothetical protein FB567DRAFT_318874 [Paraphoma chrysanthemicola]|uniref:F-box domain-containing protein n=1 Tax=Paraphoma chrysanthemicola TaxID=798071 RepID=A0A8K0R7L6_9PLEO|nr:hypothetical protein FB567DRAFT_318874 [Paraphoma chrysanthemicola]
MPQLNDLPLELLEMVAYRTRTLTNATSAYHSLRQLALVCRRLRQTAQEALHRHIIIGISDYEPFFDDDEGGGGESRLGSLVRTFLQRPDLATIVKGLEVNITPRHIGYFGRCYIYKDRGKDYCKCYWDDTVELCKNFLLMTKFWNGPTLYDDQWMQNIEDGSQLAVLGVILACTYGLETLVVDRFSGF